MDRIDIFRGNNLVTKVMPDANSTQSKQIMGDNRLSLSFKMNRYVDFQIGDFCTVFGEQYYVTQPPTVKKVETYLYEYSLQMDSAAADLSKVQYLFLNAQNLLLEGDFALMGNPATFMNLLLQNLQRYSLDWTIGQVIAGPYKVLSFSKESCYNALSRLAQEFDTEFWIEGHTIHLTRRRNDTALLFRHGRNRGLYDITRTNYNNSSVCTRLYCYGSDKNLPPDYRGGLTRLVLPSGDVFLESNITTYGLAESTEIFEDIYPHRTGTVTAVSASDIYQLTDVNIDFDINAYLLPGITAKVTFNTGQLAGYTFEISSYNHALRVIKFLKNKNERVLDVPNASMKPAIGDKFVLTDIRMPQAYITAAEEELRSRARALLEQVSVPQMSYTVVIDPLYMKRYGYSLSIGDEVKLQDLQLSVDRKIRVTKVTRNIVDEYAYEVDLSDIVTPSTMARIMSAQYDNERGLQQLQQSVQGNALLNGNVIGPLNFSALPTTTGGAGFSELLVETATGQMFRKI
jgi:hypothetical protein